MKTLISLILFCLTALPVVGQGVRSDPQPVTTISGQPLPGMQFPAVLAIPNASVSVCNYPANGNPCTNFATTYTDATLASACPADQQVTLNGQNSCQSTADQAGNFGFWVAPGNYVYQFTLTTGQSYGPYSFTAGVSSLPVTGVTKLIPGINCTVSPSSGVGDVTFNCAGGTGGGGVDPGNKGNLAYYPDATHVAGDPFLNDTAAGNTDPNAGALSYNGPEGASFQSTNGGLFTVTLNSVDNNHGYAGSIITLSTELDKAETTNTGAGNINITTDDKANNAQGSIINITALEEGSGSASGVVNITASAPSLLGEKGGIVNITAQSNGSNAGNVNITALGPGGGNITELADPTFGTITLGGSLLIMTTPNFTVDASGNEVANNIVEAKGGFTADDLTPSTCVGTDAGKHLVSIACGGGGGVGGSGTGLHLSMWAGSGASTTLMDSHLDDGLSTIGFITSTEPIIVADGSGTGGTATGQEGTVPTPGPGQDTWWASSTQHRWDMNNNNTGTRSVVGTSPTASTAGNCVKYDTNGYDVVDAGGPCLLSSSTTTPTLTIDSGAGTGGSLSVSLVAGGNDQRGWINITTGNSTVASAGVVTVKYSGTYATAQKCIVEGSNAATSALTGTGKLFVSSGSSTTTLFVIQVGATALAVNTPYQVAYSCGL